MTIYAFEGRVPEIDPTAWVAPDANVVGTVLIGARASIWFCATLRGDNEAIIVGDGSNLQENVVCHTDPGTPVVVGRDCTIGHKAMLHSCSIGDRTLIGMGATILNRARIGSNCLVGAGALVTEDKEIPDGSLVMGFPAKVVRPLTDAEIAGLLRSAEGYAAKAERFRAGLASLDE